MSEFIESLKRLCESEKVSKEKIDKLLDSQKITVEEHLYILGKENKHE